MDITIVLPSNPVDIINRLSAVNGESSLVKELYPDIAKHAGAKLRPEGVVMLFTLAISDYSQNYPPFGGTILYRLMPRWIDAIVDDKVAVEAVNEFINKVDKDVEAAKPVRIAPVGPIEDDNLYLAVRKIVDIFYEEVARWDVNHLISVTFTDDGVNPFYNQTEIGLFVEYYYGHPSKVWTPWGYFHFTGSVGYSGNAPWDDISDNFTRRLGATLYLPEKNTKAGTYGPVYAVHTVDSINLPEPKVRERQNFLEYEVAKNAWKNMSKRYVKRTRFQKLWQAFVSFLKSVFNTNK